MTAPANDLRVNAQLLTGTSGSVSGTTVDCVVDTESGGVYDGWYDVWFYWADFPAGRIRFELDIASAVYTELALYAHDHTTAASAGNADFLNFTYATPYSVEVDHPGGELTAVVATFDPDVTAFDITWRKVQTTPLLADDFSGSLVVGSGNWAFKLQADAFAPYTPNNSGGVLHLPYAGYLFNTQLSSYDVYPLRCTTWTWNVDDLPLADIYAGDFFRGTLLADGGKGTFRWNLRWMPATLSPPETAGTDTAMMLYPSWNTRAPTVGSGVGTPVPFDISYDKWLRIREECHELLWEKSPDGDFWVTAQTLTLPDGFVYESDYAMSMGFLSGYGTPSGTPFDWTFESVSIEKLSDCLCPGGGWHVGRVGAGGSW